MNKIKSALKNKKGIMGIDYICVAGVVITITVYILTNLTASGTIIADNAIDQLNEVVTITTPVAP